MKRLCALAMVAALLAGCGTTISPAQATRDWIHQSNYHENRATLIHDVDRARSQLKLTNSATSTLHTVCGILLTDVEAANSALPTPDDQASTLLASAYQTLGDGANTCYRAGADPVQRQRAINYLNRGQAGLSFATIRLGIVSAG